MTEKKVYRNFFIRILIWLDQGGNVLYLNGSEDHTISGRTGYKAMTTGKWYWLAAEKFIDTLFFWQKNHCRNAIEGDEYLEFPLFGWNVLVWVLTMWGIYEYFS